MEQRKCPGLKANVIAFPFQGSRSILWVARPCSLCEYKTESACFILC